MSISDYSLITSTSRVLQERLPPGWEVERVAGSGRAPRLRITSKEGRSRELPVSPLSRPDPRTARQLPKDRPLLVAAPYLSRGVREAIEDEGASYVDQTGNVRLVLDEPGLFIATSGAESNPWPEERRFTLRGAKAGRVVCALARATAPIGVRELAAAADTDPGYVSRLLGMLDREAIVDRNSRGQVARVDWRKLLLRWSEEAPLESRTTASTWLAPRGLKSLWDGLRDAAFPYLVTGSAAAAGIAPVAPTRLASVYVEDPEGAAKALGLRAADAGANVVLLQPEDGSLFDRAEDRDGLRTARLPVVVADLLSGPGRSPAEAEALMERMAVHEEVWRGASAKTGVAAFFGPWPGEETDAELLAALKAIAGGLPRASSVAIPQVSLKSEGRRSAMRLEATVPASRGYAVQALADQHRLSRSQIIDEALSLFLKVVLEIRQGRRLVTEDPRGSQALCELTTPTLTTLKWALSQPTRRPALLPWGKLL